MNESCSNILLAETDSSKKWILPATLSGLELYCKVSIVTEELQCVREPETSALKEAGAVCGLL